MPFLMMIEGVSNACLYTCLWDTVWTDMLFSFFSEKDYDLYDYWTVSFEQARRYRQNRNQYLRRNQWEDLKVEVYIRTK